MFTGIIEQIGTIQRIEGNRFTISHAFEEDFEIGESVACNGVCLTILTESKSKDQEPNPKNQTNPNDQNSKLPQTFTVEIIEASRKVTTFGTSSVGDKVNLERSAIIGQRNSGHNVTGHIDQVGRILKLEKKSDYHLIRIGIHPENRKLIVHKGSVAVEGISLTVSGVSNASNASNASSANNASKEEIWFEVLIISHTWEETNLPLKKVGDGVNLEFDILGKYALNHIQ